MMQEAQLLQFDSIINDFTQVFSSKHSNSIFSSLITKYNFKLADAIDFTDSLRILFFYNYELKIAINSLFLNGVVVSFSIIHFW